jgi:putative ABC transport system permease protein
MHAMRLRMRSLVRRSQVDDELDAELRRKEECRDARGLRFVWHTVVERLAALPGVVSASASNGAILNGDIPTAARLSDPMRVAGVPPKPTTLGDYRTFIMPRVFETIGVPLVAGREFTERDTENAPPVVIINETLARRASIR